MDNRPREILGRLRRAVVEDAQLGRVRLLCSYLRSAVRVEDEQKRWQASLVTGAPAGLQGWLECASRDMARSLDRCAEWIPERISWTLGSEFPPDHPFAKLLERLLVDYPPRKTGKGNPWDKLRNIQNFVSFLDEDRANDLNLHRETSMKGPVLNLFRIVMKKATDRLGIELQTLLSDSTNSRIDYDFFKKMEIFPSDAIYSAFRTLLKVQDLKVEVVGNNVYKWNVKINSEYRNWDDRTIYDFNACFVQIDRIFIFHDRVDILQWDPKKMMESLHPKL